MMKMNGKHIGMVVNMQKGERVKQNMNTIGMQTHNHIKQELKDLDQMKMIMNCIGMVQDI